MAPYDALAPAHTSVQVYDWDFNMFEVDRASGGRPLYTATMALLQDQGLLVRPGGVH